MRVIARLLCLAANVLLLGGASLALATDTPTVGGSGGGPFRLQCPPGHFLVGLEGRTGLWIDQITALCARWERTQTQSSLGFPVRVGRFGGAGGGPRSVVCPGNSVISGWTIHPSHGEPPMVEYFFPKCRAALPPYASVDIDLQFGDVHPVARSTFSHPFMAAEEVHECPRFQVAVGVYGASGAYVDRLGLICGPLPPIRIRSGPGKCLDVHAPDQLKNGARVQVWDCNIQDQQDWHVVDRALVTRNGKCLDVHAPDQYTNGGKVQIWDCNGAPQQQWTLLPDRTLRSAAGKCLDVHAPEQLMNGGRVQVWDCNPAVTQQHWLFR